MKRITCARFDGILDSAVDMSGTFVNLVADRATKRIEGNGKSLPPDIIVLQYLVLHEVCTFKDHYCSNARTLAAAYHNVVTAYSCEGSC